MATPRDRARSRFHVLKKASARSLLAVSVILAVVLASAGIADAYLSSIGISTSGTATTSILNPPTSVAGAQTVGSGTVTVSWTASVSSAKIPAPTGYYVTRTNTSSSSTVNACGTSSSVTINATTCSDGSVPVGTYTYRVIAVYHMWTATSASSATVSVVQASQAITFTSTASSPNVGGPTYTAIATGGGSGNAVTFTSGSATVCTSSGTNGSVFTFVGTGTCVINANQAAGTYYTAAPQKQQTFTVAASKTNQTITFSSTAPSPGQVGSTTYTAVATATSALTVTFTSATPAVCTSGGTNGSVFTFVAAGTCTINANQAGNGTYNAAPTKTQTITVVVPPTITSLSPSPFHTGHKSSATLTVTGTGFVAGLTLHSSDTDFTFGLITSLTSTSFTVVVSEGPANNASADLTVTNPDGGSVTFANALST